MSDKRALRVLLVTGGHPFEREPFFEMFRALPGVTFDAAEYPAALDAFRPERFGDHDAWVFYDFGNTMPDESRRHFLDAVGRGKGLLFLHHSVYSQPNWPEYRDLVGAAWAIEPLAVGGKTYGPSVAVNDQRVKVTVADPGHPVTAGIGDFELLEETYGNYYVSPSVSPLLVTDHPKSERPLAWAQTLGPARTAYLQPGHGPETYRNPNYRRLVANAIHWTARREPPQPT